MYFPTPSKSLTEWPAAISQDASERNSHNQLSSCRLPDCRVSNRDSLEAVQQWSTATHVTPIALMRVQTMSANASTSRIDPHPRSSDEATAGTACRFACQRSGRHRAVLGRPWTDAERVRQAVRRTTRVRDEEVGNPTGSACGATVRQTGAGPAAHRRYSGGIVLITARPLRCDERPQAERISRRTRSWPLL